MRGTTPQWLYGALDDALVSAGSSASAQTRRAFIDRVISAWNLEGRSLHNCRYLAQVFEKLDELEGATSEPENLKLAAAVRGALEEPGWEEDADMRGQTTFPAMVGLDDLRELGIDDDVVSRVGLLAEQLASHNPRDTDLSAKLLVDADLSVLASPPQQYRDYLMNLREEVPHMSEISFLRARRNVLLHLLGKPRVFSTPLASRWEDSARNNLEAELENLDAKLSRHVARDGAAAQPVAVAPPAFLPADRQRPSSVQAKQADGSESPQPMLESEDGDKSLGDVVDQFGNVSRPRTHTKVLRISRSQKAARMKAPAEEGTPAVLGVSAGEGTLAMTLSDADAGEPQGQWSEEEDGRTSTATQRTVDDTAQFVSDTSTLESVADLIETRNARRPKGRA